MTNRIDIDDPFISGVVEKDRNTLFLYGVIAFVREYVPNEFRGIEERVKNERNIDITSFPYVYVEGFEDDSTLRVPITEEEKIKMMKNEFDDDDYDTVTKRFGVRDVMNDQD